MKLRTALIPLLILGGLTLFVIENWSPRVPLILLNVETVALPLGIWVLIAALAGALTTLAIALCLQLFENQIRSKASRGTFQSVGRFPDDGPGDGSGDGAGNGFNDSKQKGTTGQASAPRESGDRKTRRWGRGSTDFEDVSSKDIKPQSKTPPSKTTSKSQSFTASAVDDWEDFSRPRQDWDDWQRSPVVKEVETDPSVASGSRFGSPPVSDVANSGQPPDSPVSPPRDAGYSSASDGGYDGGRYVGRDEYERDEYDRNEYDRDGDDERNSVRDGYDYRSDGGYRRDSERDFGRDPEYGSDSYNQTTYGRSYPGERDRQYTQAESYADQDRYVGNDYGGADYSERGYGGPDYGETDYRRADYYRETDYRGTDYEESGYGRDGYGQDGYPAADREGYQSSQAYSEYSSQGVEPEAEPYINGEQFIMDYGDEAALDAFDAELEAQVESGSKRSRPQFSKDSASDTASSEASGGRYRWKNPFSQRRPQREDEEIDLSDWDDWNE